MGEFIEIGVNGASMQVVSVFSVLQLLASLH